MLFTRICRNIFRIDIVPDAYRVLPGLMVCLALKQFYPVLAQLPESVVKGVRTTVGCAGRTIPNKELRFPNGAHGTPYISF